MKPEGDPDPKKMEQLAFLLFKHPLAQRFEQKSDVTNDNRVFTAADVLGERLMRIAALLLMAANTPEILLMNVAENDRRLAAADVARIGLTAMPYLWTEEVRMAIRAQEGPIPRHVLSPRLLPSPSMWWTFETGLTVAQREIHGTDVAVDVFLVRDSADAFEVYMMGQLENEKSKAIWARLEDKGTWMSFAANPELGMLPFLVCSRFPYGKTYPDDYEDSPSFPMLQSVLSLLAFLNSPYIPKKTERLLRAERREIRRRRAVDAGEEITFVTLRRPTPRSHSKEKGGTVDWKHRWIVSGHYRAQWYPSEAAHHVIWIAPYIKGPDDAPMIEHAYRVAR